MKLNTALKETMEFPGCAFREVFLNRKNVVLLACPEM